MPHEVIIIKKNATGKYFFIIRDSQDTQLATSKSFESEKALIKCLETIQLSLVKMDADPDSAHLIFKGLHIPKDHTFSMMTLDGEVLIQSYHFLTQDTCQKAQDACKNAFIHLSVSL